MKQHGLVAVAACIVVIGVVWAGWPAPSADQAWSYQKLQPVDARALHGDALGFVTANAHEGFELHTRHAEAASFEIRCKGILVMGVENTPSRVLIRMPADAARRAPDVEHLRASFERWLEHHQSRGRLLVERAGPSWIEARFGRFNGVVPDGQRCLQGPHGSRWPRSPLAVSPTIPDGNQHSAPSTIERLSAGNHTCAWR